MEIGDIAYTEYSREECLASTEEFDRLAQDSHKLRSALVETTEKIRKFIADQNLLSKVLENITHFIIGIEGSILIKDIDAFTWKQNGEDFIKNIIINVWRASRQGKEETIFVANLSTRLVSIIKEEILKTEELQKKADSFLYRCESLIVKNY